jgi:hypothetical protein
MKMPADETEVHSAADILRAIDNLVAFQKVGMMDVTDNVSRAIGAFDAATCNDNADALAFISMSRRLAQFIIADGAEGKVPETVVVEACDRYMETAIAFLRLADIRERTSAARNKSIH